MKHPILLSLFFAVITLHSQAATRFAAQPTGSKMRIDGTSNIHDWTVDSALIGGWIEVDEKFPAAPAAAIAPGKFEVKALVSISVRSLKSGKTAMDVVMHEAMKFEKQPRIQYTIKTVEIKAAPAKPGDPVEIETAGDLSVSGVSKPVKLKMTMLRTDKNELIFAGQAAVKMTDFGITPPQPKLALGLIKTGDEVKLKFEWRTQRAEK